MKIELKNGNKVILFIGQEVLAIQSSAVNVKLLLSVQNVMFI